jgi:hypothetical protein
LAKKKKRKNAPKFIKEIQSLCEQLYSVKKREFCIGNHNYTAVKNLFVRSVNPTPKLSPQLSVGRRLKPPVVRTPANRKTNASRETETHRETRERERGRRMRRWARMMIRKKLEQDLSKEDMGKREV